jgi:NhaA family Na+:H+ antiporter
LLQGGINADVAVVLTAFAIPIDAAAPAHSKAEAEHPGVPPSLVDHLIHLWVPLTSLLIMPVFALANTAVSLGGAAGSVLSLLQMPVAQGIGLGLVLGKPVGITLTALAGIKLGLAKWPTGMHEGHLWTVGVLGGIGFTMSLFLIECSLTGTSAAAGKLAILAASVTAAAVGAVLMNMMDPVAQEGDSKGNPLIKPVVEPSPTVVPLPSPQ